MDGIKTDKISVCIIGGGVAGLTTLKWLSEYPEQIKVTLYDRYAEIGGLWSYGDKMPEYGTPSALYQGLR